MHRLFLELFEHSMKGTGDGTHRILSTWAIVCKWKKNGAPSFLIVMSPNLDPVIHFSDLMRENLVANEVVRKVNFRLAIHGNVA